MVSSMTLAELTHFCLMVTVPQRQKILFSFFALLANKAKSSGSQILDWYDIFKGSWRKCLSARWVKLIPDVIPLTSMEIQ